MFGLLTFFSLKVAMPPVDWIELTDQLQKKRICKTSWPDASDGEVGHTLAFYFDKLSLSCTGQQFLAKTNMQRPMIFCSQKKRMIH